MHYPINLLIHLQRNWGIPMKRKESITTAFQIVIGGIVKAVLLVLLTLLLGILQSTFTVLLFFAALRVVAGGYHMDNYKQMHGDLLRDIFRVRLSCQIYISSLLECRHAHNTDRPGFPDGVDILN